MENISVLRNPLCLILGGKRIGKRYCYVGFVALVLFVGIRWNKAAQITFLDVGQGDCAVVETEEGQCFLFDCGSSSKGNVGEKYWFRFYNIRELEKLTVSFYHIRMQIIRMVYCSC